ncbi:MULTISPECIES: ankyrin repeat domain-containing protein [unclassified Coleofasciculus]|uniref:ankyrin repeat domain-containing protein n=1 Tax=unclassified Coleofasciculus TaxID=2692782 RepID=UPI001881A861|nr:MULTISPECIES: ankyrin repeat domain-containing protein [unclassified Coleofasciculus]MBE9128988.1 ankyrin repeat domain-containing protein [Coleofasciculus sp. LEGE 07081]MBE9151725.1 ankyrin repeat domain-containing protein [Coleofasciculus sp. LEGE 07092]
MEHLQAPDETIVQRYRLLEPLAQGGSGITYLGEDLETGKRVTLKELSLRHLHDWQAMEQFEQEAQILAQLNHPGIPRYLDYFHLDTPSDRSFYIVQQFAPGCSLAQLVQKGWYSNELEIRQIAIQVLEILVYLHQQTPPVIHRDIKPDNIIRADDGQIVLVDFGAVQNTYYSTLAISPIVVGTLGYMAPEQFLGKAVPATDLYGLGTTLLFLLTHRSPADLPIHTLAFDSRCFRLQIAAAFADWLETMLEPDLNYRFSTAETALTELQNQRISVKLKPVKSQAAFWKPVVSIGILASVILGIHSFKYPILSTLRLTPPQVYETAEQGDITTIQHYLKKGVGVNARNGEHKTPLHWVGSKDVAQLLIAEGADVNATDWYGWTPLHYARSPEIAALLIANGADVHAKSQPNWERLHRDGMGLLSTYNWAKLLPGLTPLHIARSPEIAQLLIEQGAEVNAKDAKTNRTPLHLAHSPEVAVVLIKNGAEIDAEEINREFHPNGTLLHQATKIGSKLMIEFLLQRGANIVAKDYQGNTPLHLALSPEIAALLIADVNVRNSEGETLLHKAVENSKTELVEFLLAQDAMINAQNNQGQTPLHKASNTTLIELLLNRNADINAQDDYGNTPLHVAAWNNLEAVQLLIQKGAEINIQDIEGKTPLHSAGLEDIALFLVDSGAEINGKDIYGETPLHKAVRNNWSKLVVQLLARGADVNAINYEHKTPLELAQQNYIKQLLKEYGAIP